VLAQDSYEAIHDSGPAWYGSVWRVSAIFAGDDQASFACMALTCHGLNPAVWTLDLSSTT
jgi:hypothetical protein